MKQSSMIAHEFVATIPERIEDNKLYICIDYATVVHNCCCGCGREVVTPLSPTDWKLIYDGEVITLWPSIGNWSFECQSHYYIEKSAIRWASQWTAARIEAGRKFDRRAKEEYFTSADPDIVEPKRTDQKPRRKGFWWRLRRLLSG